MINDDLSQVYAEHNGWLKQWLYRRLGCSAQAADLAQDTFLRILQAQQKAGASLSLQRPRAYLATVSRRLVYDHFRRQSLERAYLEMLAQLPELFALSAEEQCSMRETLQQLDALLDTFKPVVRSVFLLVQLEGLTYIEVARRLGIGERTVKRHMANALEACILFDEDF
ncbi:sigma-70 family RNA polymerase sigma factor [Pseudomonas sp. TWI929]|uniref:sigma-70 family RNA polymerase sigma factor n=1 Tax=Pseudomonas sp. TWI929 TaxID=3136795 RepID=UPI00320A9F3B